MSGEAKRFQAFGAGALLLMLLAVLASLQFRWIGQVSEAERDRLEERLGAAAIRFAGEIDRELTRAFLHFQPHVTPREPEHWRQRLPDQWSLWREDAPFPDLVADLHVLRLEAGGSLSRLDPERRRYTPVEWPAELEGLRQRLATRRGGGFGGGREWLRSSLPVLETVPALVIPVGVPPAAGGRGGSRRPRPPEALLVVRLDRTFLTEELLPELTERHFSQDAHVLVRRRGGPQPAIYSSDPSLRPDVEGDLVVPFLQIHPFDELRGPGLAPGSWRRAEAAARPPGRAPEGPGLPSSALRGRGGAWELVVVHRAGSLEQVVRTTRRRNLAISLGILAVLGSSLLLMARSSQRSQRLARQQIAFVAGLTHELHTPLAAIRSAAENLADGVITDPERVRTYGALIHRQGSRLSSMVDQALDFAGMQAEASEGGLDRRPVSLTEVIRAAREACEPLAAECGVKIEERVDAGLPPVPGDANALRQALENLLLNALKFAGSGGPVTIGARRAAGDRVELRLEDRGPGIPRDELAHLFEPFYRGRAARSIAGSGLGLALVKHAIDRHRGSIRVENRRGGGAAFIVELPTAQRSAD